MFILSISVFILLSLFIYLNLFNTEENGLTFILKFLCFISVLLILFGFYFGLFNISLSSWHYNSTLLLLSILIGIINKKTLKKMSPRKFKLKINSSIVLLITVITSALLSIVYFKYNFDSPQFISIDGSVHFLLGKFINENNQLLFWKRTLYFRDPETYPFGTSIITSLFSRTLPFINYLKSFQILNAIIFTGLNLYFISLSLQREAISKILIFSLYIPLIIFGFFYNMMAMGFMPQMLGLLLLLFLVDIYDGLIQKWLGVIFISITLTVIFFTYIYWLPVALLFLVFKNYDLLKKTKDEKIKFISLLAISLLLSLIYATSLYEFQILNFASSDGGTYKIFLLNFVIFIPFICSAIPKIISSLKDKKDSWSSLILSSLLYFTILQVIYAFGKVSQYTLMKSVYLIGPILYYLFVFGLSLITKEITNKKKTLLTAPLILILSLTIYFSFFNVDKSFNLSTAPSFFINNWTLNGRILDIFYLNGQTTNNPSPDSHKYNLSDEQIDFARKIKKHIPKDFKSNNIMVVASPDESLWFYAMTWIWPRVRINGKDSIWDPISYHDWLIQHESPLLVLFDTKSTKKWMISNDFILDDYTILYQEGENYLLKLNKENIPFNITKTIGSMGDISVNQAVNSPLEFNFTAEYNGLSQMSFVMSNYNSILTSDYEFEIHEANCQEKTIRRIFIDRNTVNDNDYYVIKFQRIDNSMNNQYCISVRRAENSDESNKNAVSLAMWKNTNENKMIGTATYSVQTKDFNTNNK